MPFESLIEKPEEGSVPLALAYATQYLRLDGVADDQAIRAVLFEQDHPVGEVIPPFASFRPWYWRPQKEGEAVPFSSSITIPGARKTLVSSALTERVGDSVKVLDAAKMRTASQRNESS